MVGEVLMRFASMLLTAAFTFSMSQLAQGAELRVISGGAFKQVLNALAAEYEKETGNRVTLTYQTVGQHLNLIKKGKEDFDVAILTPDAIASLLKGGTIVAGSSADLA